MRRLLFLTIALIVYGSLYPWHFDFTATRHPLAVLLNSWPAVWDRFELRDAAINLILYFPFGATALWALGRRRTFAIAPVLLSAIALSTGLELLQVYVPGRVCSLFDVLCNLTGAAAGVALALFYHPASRRPQHSHSAIPSTALLLLALFGGYQLYPFFPVLSHTRILLELQLLWSPERFSINSAACSAAEWFAAFLVIQAIINSARGTALAKVPPALALLCLPLRLVIPTRIEGSHEILGGVLAWLAWTFLADRFRLRAGICLIAAAIVLRELDPFQFSRTASPFTWIPFVPSLESDRMDALVILFRKAFDYGAVVWLLTESGVSYARAGAVVAAALMALELVQQYIPSRTPEITDSVLTLALALTLWILKNFQRRRGLG